MSVRRLGVGCWRWLVTWGWACGVAVGGGGALLSAANVAEVRARALAGFDAVVRGDRTASLAVRADLEVVLAASPGDALARAHWGWLQVLEARDLPLAAARKRAVAGIAEMDAAVRTAPHDPWVRLVRARSDYQVPMALGREAVATADFVWLVAGARAPVGVAGWAPELRREILFHAGSLALKQRRPEAVALLEEAAGVAATTPSDSEIQSMLALARRALTSQSHGEDPHPDEG